MSKIDIYEVIGEYLIDIRDLCDVGKRRSLSVNDEDTCLDLLEWLKNQDMLKKGRE